MTDLHVIGLDPSLTATGLASSQGWTKVIGQAGKKTMSYVERHERIAAVKTQVVAAVPQDVVLVVMEGPNYGSTDGHAFDRAHLWWDLYAAIVFGRSIPIAICPPSVLKTYATGLGDARKREVIDAVAHHFPIWQAGRNSNRADAVILMAAGRDRLSHPLVNLPETHRRALGSIAWPGAVHALT
ncbi:hypothetical protein [Spongiactinospora sp. TRM90649]|uniref:hypothetical protein n=1 Tax=Spongiactinospora sp. TRM90649 TaxID=3031114 RepID=UPI0023FA423A|nr:hypothetical protein [Spongiactinospora sp. TRM90649]MDF5756605.1 hypothetical protein [Spongiactinospora sp. TRM90649]